MSKGKMVKKKILGANVSYSQEVAEDLRKAHGIEIEDEIEEFIRQDILAELDNLREENEQWRKERRQISKALKLEGILGEDVAPIAYVLAAIEQILKKG